jgi:hypothetical protein
MTYNVIFITSVRTHVGKAAVRLLIESIQTFGGEMSTMPIWVFAADLQNEPCRGLASQQVEILPLQVPETVCHYPFGDKVYACAIAESLAPGSVQALIWLDLECLVVQPPVLFDVGHEFDAALRPVHIRNVGLPPSAPLDLFWHGIYTALGIQDVQQTVNSFIDDQCLRAYFNSHGFALKPSLGLFHEWYELFERLVCDTKFQAAACQDQIHRIFLFQALFSALVSSRIETRRIRILPATYNYPYNLHSQVPEKLRSAALNDLVCFTFEDRSVIPDLITDVEIHEPLRSWLANKATYSP